MFSMSAILPACKRAWHVACMHADRPTYRRLTQIGQEPLHHEGQEGKEHGDGVGTGKLDHKHKQKFNNGNEHIKAGNDNNK